MPEISRVGVLGCGLMGSGIAQAAATAGLPDRRARHRGRLLAKGEAPIQKSLDKLVEKGKLDAGRRATRARAPHLHDRPGRPRPTATSSSRRSPRTWSSRTSSGARSTRGCPAGDDLRLQHLEPLDRRHGRGHRRGPTGSSASTSSTRCRSCRWSRWCGPWRTSRRDLRARAGLRPAARQGADRRARPLGLRRQPAARALPARRRPRARAGRRRRPPTSTAACSSAAATRWARSPCSTSSGLDTAVRIAEIMFDEYREPRFAPPPLLRRMVAAGLHGRKSGRGFYDYASDPPDPHRSRTLRRPDARLRLAPAPRRPERPARRAAAGGGALRPGRRSPLAGRRSGWRDSGRSSPARSGASWP